MAVNDPARAGLRSAPTYRPRFLLLAGLIAIVTVIALPVITYPLGRDQGEFATIGRGILDGKIPYVDLWNPKPPAVFYVYGLAMTLFGRTTEALRGIDLLIFPVIAGGLYWIGRRMANARVGLWAALLFGVFYFTETFWTLTQNDGIVLLPMTLAMVCAIQAADGGRRSALWAFGAGALTAYAVWFKYPFVFFAGAVAAAYVWIRATPSPRLTFGKLSPLPRKRGEGGNARDILAFVGGSLIVGLGGAAYMAAIGAWDALVESARVTASYTAQGIGDVGAALQTALGFRWEHWGGLFLLALGGLALGIRRFNRQSSWWIAIAWLAAGAAMMVVQLKFYDYHWLPMLPPLALIGAGTVEHLVGEIGRRGGSETRPYTAALRGGVAVALLAAMCAVIWSRALPYLTGAEDQAAYYSYFQAGEFVANESLEVATFLRERVAPGDSLFIWGFRPEVYYLSQLNPASRFIFQFPLVAGWYPAEWRQQTVDILWAALPPYALVVQVDYMPWVTGSDEDSLTLLQAYTELNNWLEYNYVRDTQIGNFFIWRRISTSK